MRSRSGSTTRILVTVLFAALVLIVAPVAAPEGAQTVAAKPGTTWPRVVRKLSPARSIVTDANGWVATFTDGARTVSLAGPRRTFAEATTPYEVTTTTWVRLLPAPFAGKVDFAWLNAARADTAPDLLAIAFQYQTGAPSLNDATGMRYAGDASYGPLLADGTRQEGSDFNDYLGRAWSYPGGTRDAPEPEQLGSLDCSGFVRMVFGYRAGVAMTLRPTAGSLPRRAFEMAASAPGVLFIPNAGVPPADRSVLAPGDLLFFDASTNDGTQIDHVAIYLGRDSGGHDRFLSSRKGADGPTMGDTSGASILDGTGLYARAFRASRRI